MANFFYTDSNGQRRGPMNIQQLNELAARGIITPNTTLETDGGRKGLAGQIPELNFNGTAPPPIQHFFCTSCGKPVSEQAVACMSCGAKPIGHKNFCRQCGVGLRPEQVVCTRCGASITAGYSGGVKRIVQSIRSTIKRLVVVAIVVVVVVILYKFVPVPWVNLSPSSNFLPASLNIASFRNANRGESLEYKITVSGSNTEEAKVSFKVIQNDGEKVKIDLKVVHGHVSFRDSLPSSGLKEINLKSQKEFVQSLFKDSDSSDDAMKDIMKDIDVKFKREATKHGVLSVAGKRFDCVVTSYTATVTAGDVTTSYMNINEWTSKEIPLGGVVKWEWQTTHNFGGKSTSIEILLTDFSSIK